jgi:chromosome segregation ATPase
MKERGQTMVGNDFDGFDRNVAEKMPKKKKEDELSISPHSADEAYADSEAPADVTPSETPTKKKALFPPQPKEGEDENLGVLKLIEDLHAQLLVSNRTKRALEMDIASSRKALHEMARENRSLVVRVERLSLEIQKLQETRSELAYLEEENEDALERITSLQAEIKASKETLTKTLVERDEALQQLRILETQIEHEETLRIKGKLKEREASLYAEENRDLRGRLEEALKANGELESKYGALKKSFNEVKESLVLLRDSCKANYYNLSEESK